MKKVITGTMAIELFMAPGLLCLLFAHNKFVCLFSGALVKELEGHTRRKKKSSRWRLSRHLKK